MRDHWRGLAVALVATAWLACERTSATNDTPPASARSTPTSAPSKAALDGGHAAADDPIVQVVAGDAHTCVRTAAGRVRCWGKGANGRLGYGNTNDIGDDEPPRAAGEVDIGAPAIDLVAGAAHTCAVITGGAVRCWGTGANGRLGYGNTHDIGDDETPASAGDVELGGPVTSLALGDTHACAVLASGQVRCWGAGREHQLGLGDRAYRDIGDDEIPASVPPLALPTAVQVALQYGTSCALLASGGVRCWGPRWGQQETRDTIPDALPDVELGGPAVSISAGAEHLCARMRDTDALRCWGRGDGGRLGYPGAKYVLERGDDTPATRGDVALGGPLAAGRSAVATGGEHTCAVFVDGSLRCWGSNSFGQLGLGHTKDVGTRAPPASAPAVALGGPATAVAGGLFHTCALLASGGVRCWGRGTDGQLGYGERADRHAPGSTDVPVR